MKKKIVFTGIGVLFAIILFLSLFLGLPRLTYTYSDVYDGYLVDKAYGNAKEYTIPKEHRGKKVVGVSTRAFFRHSKLESISFEKEDNIQYIGRLAFSECPKLKSISIDYVIEIERNAFSYDTSLESISTQAKNIGASAFYGCTALSTVELREGVASIGMYAFSQCTSLLVLHLPETVTYVYSDAFSFSGMNRIEAPASLKENTYIRELNIVSYYEGE